MNTNNEQSLPLGDILVVDDNSSNLKTMTDILTVLGYQVQAASDGELALRSVQDKQPELILLDYKMPGMDGIEVCRRLKADIKTEDIPIIFLSAHGEIDMKVKALEAGAIDYVTKPVDPSEVLAKIDNHLKVYRLQRKLAAQSEELKKEITEREKMEEQLFLNEKLATIAGLAAGVAHEINTPLSAILQAHQLIETGLSAEDRNNKERALEYNVDLSRVQEYLKASELDYFLGAIRESALNASYIIKNLQEFSRPHEGSFSCVDLSGLMEKALLLSQSDYDMKKKYGIARIQVVKEFSPGLPFVNCSAIEIEQVLLHLIKNSVQSLYEAGLQENPRITLRTSSNKTHAVIKVEDNGPGIPEDIKSKIFDPFFTTREVGTGTGLGLSVSHAIIVDKHKGEIRVESKPDKGAKFIIELPLSTDV